MDSAVGHLASPRWGCPIRTSPDHSLLAAPRGLSQPSTSFVGSWCQGIHRAPFLARRFDLSNTPSRQDQCSQQLQRTKKTFSFKELSPFGDTELLSAQLLFDSSGAEPEAGTKKARRPSSQTGQHGKSSFRLCDWRLQLSDDPSLLESLYGARDTTLVARPANDHYIAPAQNGASPFSGSGAEGIRTPDLRRAKAALSQLSYGPSATGWASLESNQGPQSYQDCALAD
jgi:hypothetical protein